MFSGSPTLKAINYALSHGAGLVRFLDDGRIDIDNNPVERSMRSIALQRNYAKRRIMRRCRRRVQLLHQTRRRKLHIITTTARSEEHTSELQSLMRISYAVFCLTKKTTKKKNTKIQIYTTTNIEKKQK